MKIVQLLLKTFSENGASYQKLSFHTFEEPLFFDFRCNLYENKENNVFSFFRKKERNVKFTKYLLQISLEESKR